MGAGEMPLDARALAGPVRTAHSSLPAAPATPAAFARLVELHEGMVVNLSARLLGDAEEARDVAQEVFLQVYRMLGRFEGRSSLKTWIYRIAVNQCHNRRRFWQRRRRDREEALDEGLLARAGVAAPGRARTRARTRRRVRASGRGGSSPRSCS